MTFDHLALTIGLIAMALLFASVFGFRAINNKLRNKHVDAYNKFQRFTLKLDALRALPLLWVVSGAGILVWLVTRVIISYL